MGVSQPLTADPMVCWPTHSTVDLEKHGTDRRALQPATHTEMHGHLTGAGHTVRGVDNHGGMINTTDWLAMSSLTPSHSLQARLRRPMPEPQLSRLR